MEFKIDNNNSNNNTPTKKKNINKKKLNKGTMMWSWYLPYFIHRYKKQKQNKTPKTTIDKELIWMIDSQDYLMPKG